jgi:hypothetical protein
MFLNENGAWEWIESMWLKIGPNEGLLLRGPIKGGEFLEYLIEQLLAF